MPLQKPVALSFDLVKKDRKTISAIVASEKFKKTHTLPFVSMQSELRDLKSSQKDIDIGENDSSDNVELDSEGKMEDLNVVKKKFSF